MIASVAFPVTVGGKGGNGLAAARNNSYTDAVNPHDQRLRQVLSIDACQAVEQLTTID